MRIAFTATAAIYYQSIREKSNELIDDLFHKRDVLQQTNDRKADHHCHQHDRDRGDKAAGHRDHGSPYGTEEQSDELFDQIHPEHRGSQLSDESPHKAIMLHFERAFEDIIEGNHGNTEQDTEAGFIVGAFHAR